MLVCSGIPLIFLQSVSASIIIADYLERIWLIIGHRKTRWQPVLPEIQQVLDKMGYTKKIKFGFRPGINTAYTFRNSIVFDPVLFFSMSCDQVRCVTAHEVHHMKNRYIKYLLGLILVAEIAGVISFYALPKLMMVIAFMSMMHLLMTVLGWKIEYDADVSGAKYTSKETMISVLELFKNYFGDKSSFTHPSASNRIKNIQSLRL
ncbi:MAG: M48 family metalloprotease [Candidatus Odinarchaeia archaeon]